MKPRMYSGLIRILSLLLLFPTATHATVTDVAWYRLGENDAGAASGLAVTNTTADFIGTKHLKQFGGPVYTNAVSAAASNQVGSSLAVNFNGSNQYLSNAVVSTAINNFGIEAWVKPNAILSGSRFIVLNGYTLSGGWGLYINNGGYGAFYGGLIGFGSSSATAEVWTHLALVRDNGTATFYVNGLPAGTSTVTPNAPAGQFVIGAAPDASLSSFLFDGAVDEVRVFTFVPGQFSTNDLLLNRSGNVSTFPATGLTGIRARLNAGAVLFGEPSSAWFEWGATTNYGNVTPAQAIAGGITNTTFNRLINDLTPDATYHFRAVISNQFGIAVGGDKMFTSLVWIYSEDFDIDHTPNWVVNSGPGNNAADCFFDYSTAGIPPAPNSGGTTRGLKLEADYVGNTVGGVSVSPLGRNFTGDYVLTFDIWWNFIGPAPSGGSGSTQVTGAGIGTSGTTPQWAGGTQDSIIFGATGDGGSFADYRAYSSAAPSGYQPASGVFAAGITMQEWDNLAAYYVPLTGNAPPAAQTALFPQQTGTPSSGAPAFKWHRGQIVKSATNVTFSLDGLLIATIDPGTVTLGGGNILFNQFDVNALSSTDPLVRFLEFGLIDNVVVSRPAGFVPLTAGDSNGDGIVDEDELNAVLANYFATSPWLQMTNAAGLGGTNVTFALTNDLAGAFSVEYTTNLVDWLFLGPATPRYLFTDTNAPAQPQRYYRLVWP